MSIAIASPRFRLTAASTNLSPGWRTRHDDTVEFVFVDALAVEPADDVVADELVEVWADELPEPALTELDVDVEVWEPEPLALDSPEPPLPVDAFVEVPVDACAPPVPDPEPVWLVPSEPVEVFDEVPVDACAPPVPEPDPVWLVPSGPVEAFDVVPVDACVPPEPVEVVVEVLVDACDPPKPVLELVPLGLLTVAVEDVDAEAWAPGPVPDWLPFDDDADVGVGAFEELAPVPALA